ncbi:2-C-methyl-D-erythritol 4-phosphate cytidylyltransferase [Dyadobacter arcticus]|uniref:2-C-methyl-D-erythritol 4-phosphate cytidylyltransferase n=1 Tax=Dyadobacter arcticus TaxID=1078754 RepID=A0ABX0UWC8_9BACT|nr:2-C-methyl-D-erythritol 4-phosphate cytidylyltransferase [Dyadobacter arcticus]NIJ55900.1 2-C-methyl-D-erythritol 4-phosphate cytidylyltransferase [Dyadobacter arcticus]
MQEYAIIVAGGSGSRMKSDIPKQFLPIHGLPVLMHTIKAFRRYSDQLIILVVLPENQIDLWQELCEKHHFHETYGLVKGGETRFQSVSNGLMKIKDADALVAVHDGVRPVIFKEIIADSFKVAARSGSAVVSVPLKDSIRLIIKDKNKAVDRSQFRLIQTPQTFRLSWMQDAFTTSYQETFTDCASVLEAKGYPIFLIEGSYENIKITTPEDLLWAEVYLKP